MMIIIIIIVISVLTMSTDDYITIRTGRYVRDIAAYTIKLLLCICTYVYIYNIMQL